MPKTHTISQRDIAIFIEQVRLVFASMKSSLYLGTALAGLLTLALYTQDNQYPLLGWLMSVVVMRVICVRYASWALDRGITADNVQATVRWMTAFKLLEGMAWGALGWVVMGKSALPDQLLVMASLAGVSSNAVSLLAPVMPVYVGMQFGHFAVMSARLVSLDDGSYWVLALGCLLFCAGLLSQAVLSQRSSRESIALRFENLDLISQLTLESNRAEQARQKAEAANLAKSKFLAAASHDLRQPVQAQELFLEALGRSSLNTHQQQILYNARAASQASAQMLNTLLDFSRIEAGVIEPQRRSFHLQPLLKKLEHELAGLADAKNILYRCRETTLAVDSDPALLELMLRNLITNAIRYTEQGGILIACRKRKDEVQIEVVDTGIGIAAQQQEAIFLEFHQLGNPERDRLKGLGLGLAITKGLAQSLKHRISVVSKVGRGSTFRVHVPMGRGALSEDVFMPAMITTVPSSALSGLRVLVIDDDALVSQALKQLLESWGCECRVSESFAGALEQTRNWSVQLIISDYRLRENQTGAEVIKQLRRAHAEDLPALIITGDTAPARLREAHRSGIPLLHKPVSPNQLYRVLVESALQTPTHA